MADYRGSRRGSVGERARKGFGVAKIAGYPEGMWGQREEGSCSGGVGER